LALGCIEQAAGIIVEDISTVSTKKKDLEVAKKRNYHIVYIIGFSQVEVTITVDSCWGRLENQYWESTKVLCWERWSIDPYLVFISDKVQVVYLGESSLKQLAKPN